MSDSDIDNLLGSLLEEDKYWTASRTKLLAQCRLDAENHFKEGVRKKSLLWRVVYRDIKNKDPNFSFTVDECMKKYNNLMTTYKRVRNKNKKSGNKRSHWEYFEIFDAVYGTTHSINPPNEQMFSSFQAETNQETFVLSEGVEIEATNSSEQLAVPTKKRKSELNTFLEKFQEEEKVRHQEFMALEKEQLVVEQEKLKLLKELKALMLSD